MRVQEETVQVPANGQQAAALIQQDAREVSLAVAHQIGMVLAAAAPYMTPVTEKIRMIDRHMQEYDSEFYVRERLIISFELGGDR